MSETYEFGNLSPIEFETLCVDLLSQEVGLDFERFSPGADGGIDGRHSSAAGNKVLQAKHYKNSTWNDLKAAAKREHKTLVNLSPSEYYFLTSQPLTPARKAELVKALGHPAVSSSRIWGRAELNDKLRQHPKVERRQIKLWLSSSAVLERIVHNDIAIFTEATEDEVARILRVYVENPSLKSAAEVLQKRHSLIISGPPGVGKTTLAQVLAAEYCDAGWELVAISEIEEAFAAFNGEENQVFIFDDFLGKIKLDPAHLTRSEGRIGRLMDALTKRKNKRFIMTTRSYVLQSARELSEVLNDRKISLSEIVLDLSVYTREIRAKILYNHLYHSDLSQGALNAVVSGNFPKCIIDHRNYMPRIVQWMTDESVLDSISDDQYPDYFLQTLNNPEKIWDKAFRQHISLAARWLLIGMYFIERSSFPTPGVAVDRLKKLFCGLIAGTQIGDSVVARGRLFEAAMREVKSSFVVVDGDQVNFINPSVLDFLSKEVADPDVLERLALAACHLDELRRVWEAASGIVPVEPESQIRIAKAIQSRLIAGNLDGRMSFRKAATLIEEVLWVSASPQLVAYLRRGGLSNQVWINETELVPVIEDLEERKYCMLPHAKAYARLLRAKLHRYIIDREYVLDLEEVADLLQSASDSFVEFPQDFWDALDEAVAEAIESLEPLASDARENPETVLGGWLEQIEKIESASNNTVDRSKKSEIEEALVAYEMHQQARIEEYRETERFRGQSSSSGFSSLQSKSSEGFTDRELDSLFSSLQSKTK